MRQACSSGVLDGEGKMTVEGDNQRKGCLCNEQNCALASILGKERVLCLQHVQAGGQQHCITTCNGTDAEAKSQIPLPWILLSRCCFPMLRWLFFAFVIHRLGSPDGSPP